MILNATKFGGNRTKDVEVGQDGQTDRQTDRPIHIYPPNYVCGGYKKATYNYKLNLIVVWLTSSSKIYNKSLKIQK